VYADRKTAARELREQVEAMRKRMGRTEAESSSRERGGRRN